MTDCIGVVYAQNKAKLSWPIWKAAVYEEKETRQQRDRLYRYGLDQNETKLSWSIR